MEALTIDEGFLRDQVAQKLIYFGANGVNVFQGTKNGVTKHIHDTYAFHPIGVHCMAHNTNLVVQTLLGRLLVVRIESLM
jgi:hypothetical protein